VFRGEILIGQFVEIARVKDVCVIENTHSRINRLAAIIKVGEKGIYTCISSVWLESYFTIMMNLYISKQRKKIHNFFVQRLFI